MGSETPKEDWKAEFQRMNSGAKSAAGTPPPRPNPGPVKQPKFAIYDATVKLYRRGATAIFGLARLNIEGRVSELSEDGADILVNEQILPDTKIHLRMEIGKFNDKIETDAVARVCRKDPKIEDRYSVAIDFVGTDPSLARKIATMRSYFTSPEGKANRERRLREERERENNLFG